MSRRRSRREIKMGTMVRNAKSDPRGYVLLIRTEPSVALCLSKEPVKKSVVPVVVHGGRREREKWKRAKETRSSWRVFMGGWGPCASDKPVMDMTTEVD
jgi:hypothetical protein